MAKVEPIIEAEPLVMTVKFDPKDLEEFKSLVERLTVVTAQLYAIKDKLTPHEPKR